MTEQSLWIVKMLESYIYDGAWGDLVSIPDNECEKWRRQNSLDVASNFSRKLQHAYSTTNISSFDAATFWLQPGVRKFEV